MYMLLEPDHYATHMIHNSVAHVAGILSEDVQGMQTGRIEPPGKL
jgi:hypothetical protein